jgi:hypothetical protein
MIDTREILEAASSFSLLPSIVENGDLDLPDQLVLPFIMNFLKEVSDTTQQKRKNCLTFLSDLKPKQSSGF